MEIIIGDNVLISSEVTHKSEWAPGKVIDVEASPFVGTVIPAQTTSGDFFTTKRTTSKLPSNPMYALSFEMSIADLQKYYDEQYFGAYYEIKRTRAEHGFCWIQGSTYMKEMPITCSTSFAPSVP